MESAVKAIRNLPPSAFILIGVIIILLILLIIYFLKVSWETIILDGLWHAEDDEFCRKAEIDGMMLYIGPQTGTFRLSVPAYLIMYADNRVIVNKVFTLDFGPAWGALFQPWNMVMKRRVTLHEENEQGEVLPETDNTPLADIMPETLTSECDLLKGHLKWYDDEEKVYLSLYRDNTASVKDS